MNCQAIRQDLSAYLDGELCTSDHRRIEAHLTTCQACREELAGLETIIQLTRDLPPVKSPIDFSQQCQAVRERDALLAPFGAQAGTHRRTWSTPYKMASALAAAAAVMLVLSTIMMHREVEQTVLPARDTTPPPSNQSAAVTMQGEDETSPARMHPEASQGASAGRTEPDNRHAATPKTPMDQGVRQAESLRKSTHSVATSITGDAGMQKGLASGSAMANEHDTPKRQVDGTPPFSATDMEDKKHDATLQASRTSSTGPLLHAPEEARTPRRQAPIQQNGRRRANAKDAPAFMVVEPPLHNTSVPGAMAPEGRTDSQVDGASGMETPRVSRDRPAKADESAISRIHVPRRKPSRMDARPIMAQKQGEPRARPLRAEAEDGNKAPLEDDDTTAHPAASMAGAETGHMEKEVHDARTQANASVILYGRVGVAAKPPLDEEKKRVSSPVMVIRADDTVLARDNTKKLLQHMEILYLEKEMQQHPALIIEPLGGQRLDAFMQALAEIPNIRVDADSLPSSQLPGAEAQRIHILFLDAQRRHYDPSDAAKTPGMRPSPPQDGNPDAAP